MFERVTWRCPTHFNWRWLTPTKIGVRRKARCDCSAGSQVVLHGAAAWALATPRVWVRYGGGVPYKTHACPVPARPGQARSLSCTAWLSTGAVPLLNLLGRPVLFVFELGMVDVRRQHQRFRNQKSKEKRGIR